VEVNYKNLATDNNEKGYSIENGHLPVQKFVCPYELWPANAGATQGRTLAHMDSTDNAKKTYHCVVVVCILNLTYSCHSDVTEPIEFIKYM